MALQVGTDCLSANRLLAAQFISSMLVTHYPKNCAAFPVCQFLHSCLFVCMFVCLSGRHQRRMQLFHVCLSCLHRLSYSSNSDPFFRKWKCRSPWSMSKFQKCLNQPRESERMSSEDSIKKVSLAIWSHSSWLYICKLAEVWYYKPKYWTFDIQSCAY